MTDVRVPDCKVALFIEEVEVGVIAFWRGKTPHDDFEIVASVEDRSLVPLLDTLLSEAIQTLKSVDWFSVSELDTRSDAHENDPPF